MSAQTTDKGTAYHEAAHAVLAHLTGVYVMEGIDLRGATEAHVNLQRHGGLFEARIKDNKGRVIDHALEEAIILAAGSEGERRYLEAQGLPVDEDALFRGAHGDVEGVQQLLGVGKWKDVRARAAYYLSLPPIWAVVENVACELLRYGGVLSANQASLVLEAAWLKYELPEWQALT